MLLAVVASIGVVGLAGYGAHLVEPTPHTDEEITDEVRAAFNDDGDGCFQADDLIDRPWSSAAVVAAGSSQEDAEAQLPPGTEELDKLPSDGAGDEVMVVFERAHEVRDVALVGRAEVDLNALASAGVLYPNDRLRAIREPRGPGRLVVIRAAARDCPGE